MKIINHFRVVLLLCVTSFSVFASSESDIKEEVFFDKSISKDATPSVLTKILLNKQNPISSIKFEKGVYHFYPDKGFEKYSYISNHCDLMVNTAFPLIGFKNLVIDGQGSIFIFHGVMIPFLVENSSNIEIKNLQIDWHEPFHSEGVIIANDEELNTFDMSISDDFPYEIRNNQLYFLKEYYEHTMGQTILYDPVRKSIAFNTGAYTPITTRKKVLIKNNVDKVVYKYTKDKGAPKYKYLGIENKLEVIQIKPGVVRVFGHKKKMPPVGYVLSMKGEQGFNRIAPAFRVSHTDGFKAINLDIHHAGGMGIIAENSSDLILDHFNITPSNGYMVSTTADATHFVGCRGKVVLKNSTITNQLDDAMNVHGTYQKIVDILDDNKVGVRMMHHQQQGFSIGQNNDRIGLVDLEKSFFAYAEMRIKNIEYINSRYQIITFNKSLPKDLKEGDLIENLDAYPDLFVQNCHIGSNRARGLLVSNPVNTVIENNFFNTEMEAILIPVESGSWFESGNAANVLIKNNIFQDCLHGGKDRGVIRFATDEENDNIAFRNIEIRDNIFNHFDNLILEVTNTDGLVFSGNTITNSATHIMLNKRNPAIKIKNSKHLNFDNNNYQGSAEKIIESDSSMSKINFK